MITCTLGEKKYTVDFVSGRALREMEPASKMYGRLVRLSQDATEGKDVSQEQLTVSVCDTFRPGAADLAIAVSLAVPAQLTVSVFDAEGALVRRLAVSELTHPGDGCTRLYWDGRAADGGTVPPGTYTVAAEAIVGGVRRKAAVNVNVIDRAPPA